MSRNYLTIVYLTISVCWILQGGCTRYSPKPIYDNTVSQELEANDIEQLRLKASTVSNPLLEPIEIDYFNGISPDEAAVMTVVGNQELRAARDKKGIARAQLLQAGLLPNPQLSYTLDFPVGGTTLGTVNAFGLIFGWDFTSLITREADIGAARAQFESVDLDIAWQEWQLAEAAKQQVYHLYFLMKQHEVSSQEEKELLKNVDSIKKAVDYGDMTIIDLSAAESTLKAVQLSSIEIEQQIKEERIKLNKSLGIPPDENIRLDANIELPFSKKIPSYEEIMTCPPIIGPWYKLDFR